MWSQQYLLDLKDDEKIEFVTKIDFNNLHRLPQKIFNKTDQYNNFYEEQIYEDVKGFEPLRIIFKRIITIQDCWVYNLNNA